MTRSRTVRIAVLSASVLAGCAVLYAVFWLWLSARIERETRAFLETMDKRPDVEVTLRELVVSGFPNAPALRIAGTIRESRASLHIPRATLRGFFIPGTTLRLDLPEGYAVHTRIDVPLSLLMLQLSRLEIVLPRSFPSDLSERSLRVWQASGQSVPVRDILLARDDGVRIQGAGVVGLDVALRPEGRLSVAVTGWDLLLRDLTESGRLKKGQEKLARVLLGALSGPDGILRTEVTFLNGGVFLGPVRLGSVEPLALPQAPDPDRHSLPVPPR